MPWLTPKTWSVGEVVTAAQMNTNLRDNMNHLYTRYGEAFLPPVLEGDGTTIFPTPSIAINNITAVSNRPTGSSQHVNFNFHVPDNYGSLRALRVLWIPQTSGTPTLECVANYRSEGQPENAHTGTITAALTQTGGQLMGWAIDAALPNLAASDYCSLRIRSTTGWPGGYFGALGVYFSWNYV